MKRCCGYSSVRCPRRKCNRPLSTSRKYSVKEAVFRKFAKPINKKVKSNENQTQTKLRDNCTRLAGRFHDDQRAGRRPVVLMERWRGQAVHCRICRQSHKGKLTGLRATGGAHRHVRQRRHALVRAADVFPIAVRAGPREGARAATSRVENEGTIRVVAEGRCEGRARGWRTRHA